MGTQTTAQNYHVFQNKEKTTLGDLLNEISNTELLILNFEIYNSTFIIQRSVFDIKKKTQRKK
jgi:hypothetical protein